MHVHNTFPSDVIKGMISQVGKKEDRFRQMVIGAALEKDRKYDEDLRKMEIKNEFVNQIPYVTRDAQRKLIN